jgi:hypothetical protein
MANKPPVKYSWVLRTLALSHTNYVASSLRLSNQWNSLGVELCAGRKRLGLLTFKKTTVHWNGKRVHLRTLARLLDEAITQI